MGSAKAVGGIIDTTTSSSSTSTSSSSTTMTTTVVVGVVLVIVVIVIVIAIAIVIVIVNDDVAIVATTDNNKEENVRFSYTQLLIPWFVWTYVYCKSVKNLVPTSFPSIFLFVSLEFRIRELYSEDTLC
ncbi:hypothetical protein GUITHDRAFT_119081 [Guillardia theta CCMP2712]|uniref:Uncharacterized protein n=1 Tax=Guillardia theta (strain CCMP2712) TaxID=905079 RepID=L1IEV8_GUITC|nr:hypothetical protein GUITHDRAFT_119081 [Guillardia theta CCMP2712]EKX34771.1 hypothetical protein GUITHDRAFT_119081 [Guillardia theta CCMP2712]|eukprot:XP_005821751.1 hypothetical protein GUITHDRAFT_119081 [Guillardia theta CCMP2712]